MYKEYLLITQSNCLFVDQREFDKLFDSLLINMPVKLKGQEYKLYLFNYKFK